MKTTLLAIGLCLLASPVFAACPSSLLLKDAAGVTAPARYTDDGSGNCMPNTVGSLATVKGWTPVVKTGITSVAVSVKGTAGWLGLVQCDNNNTVWSYLQIFDSLAPTAGVTTPVQIVPLAPGLSNGFAMSSVGVQYATGIFVSATTSSNNGVSPGTAISCSFGTN